MTTARLIVLASVLLLSGCGGGGGSASGIHSVPDGDPQVSEGVAYPDVRRITDTSREDILASTDVILNWDGHSKFGNLYSKHNGRWYLSGGFLGNTGEFVRQELGLSSGVVVYVKEGGTTPFNRTKYGPMISKSIERTEVGKWSFFFTDKASFGEFPTARDYYDTENKKIIWKDY